MFLPPTMVLKSRIHVLHNFSEITSAQLDIVERISELIADATRTGIGRVGQHSDPRQIALKFVDEMFKIASDSRKVLIKSTEAQIRVVDEIVFATLERASNFSPREVEGCFETINIALKGAEDSLHEVSSAAIRTVELSEQEFHQTSLVGGEISAGKTKKKASARAKTLAQPQADTDIS